MVVRPPRRTGTLVGAALFLLTAAMAAGLGWQVLQQVPTFASFTGGVVVAALLALALLFGYWTYGCWSLSYHLDRNRLAIRWAGNEQVVPLGEIRSLVPGPSAPAPKSLWGLSWPGYHISQGTVAGFDPPNGVLFFSTHRSRDDLLYVATPTQVYALSIPDPVGFAGELKLRQRLGPTLVLERGVRRWPLWDLPAWRDGTLVGLMALGLLINLSLFAYQAFQMPVLPALVSLPFAPLAGVGPIGLKNQLFLLPVAGLLLFFINFAFGVALHRTERFASYLFLAGGAMVQGFLWVAYVRPTV